jgi:DNA recombination protein RmuC
VDAIHWALAGLAGFVAGMSVVWLTAVREAHRAEAEANGELGRAKESLAAAQVRAEFAQRAEHDLALKAKRIEELEADLAEHKVRIASLVARNEEQLNNLADQRRLLDEAREKLADTFKALSSEALESSADALLSKADRLLQQVAKTSHDEMNQRANAIEQMLAPLKQQLAELEKNNRDLERRRSAAYGEIGEQLRALGERQSEFSSAASKLTRALQDPGTAGSWGELVLERVLEKAGLIKDLHFTTQTDYSIEESRRRPDVLVHLPGGRKVVVDAKAPIRSYLDADQLDGAPREALLKDHANKLFEHARALHKRDYAKRADSPNFVIMFVPSEAGFRAACEARPTLIEDVVALNVFVATPMTLLAFLRAVAYGWSQETLAQEARKVQEEGHKLFESIAKMAGHFERVGRAISQAGKAYNETVGSLEGNVLPKARRLKELGVPSSAKLPTFETTGFTPRPLTKLNQADEDAGLVDYGCGD